MAVKPLIGVSCSWDEDKSCIYLNAAYLKSVEAAGGIPLPLAYAHDEDSLDGIFRAVDGLILSGGLDPDPELFGEDPVPECGEITPFRDSFEMAAARRALSRNIPVLGICRGMQMLNIAAGGDIYQDIASQLGNRSIKHYQEAPRWHPTHSIKVNQGTVLASVIPVETVKVNSFHHQAVRKVAPGFKVCARSADEVIEAIESPELPFALGVQFHPETLWERRPLFLEIFKRLVEAAGKSHGV